MFRAPSSRLPYPLIIPTSPPVSWDGFPGTGYMWLSGGATIPAPAYVTGGNVYVDERLINRIVVRASGLYIAGGPQTAFDTGNQLVTISPLDSSSPIISQDFIASLGTTLLNTTGWTKFYIETSMGLLYDDSPGLVANLGSITTFFHNWP